MRVLSVLCFLVPALAAPAAAQTPAYDLVFVDGRVIDPETGLDAVPEGASHGLLWM